MEEKQMKSLSKVTTHKVVFADFLVKDFKKN